MGLTVDAEECERLDLSLDIIQAVYLSPELGGWEGFGLAIQAYQKRAIRVLDWLHELAQTGRRRIPVRLVKGAYWDSEVKRAQERGLDGYPVFTRKVNTDVSYLACARKMLAHRDLLYPMFATHNAHTLFCRARDGGSEPRVRVSATARHGRGVVCRGGRAGQARRALPGIRAGGQPRGFTAVPGAAAAGEWRQYFVRQPHY